MEVLAILAVASFFLWVLPRLQRDRARENYIEYLKDELRKKDK